jgi:hypothetical protein
MLSLNFNNVLKNHVEGVEKSASYLLYPTQVELPAKGKSQGTAWVA